MKTTTVMNEPTANGTLPRAELYLSAEFLGEFVNVGKTVQALAEGSEMRPIEEALVYPLKVVVSESQHGTYYVSELKNTKVISFVDSSGQMYLAPFSNHRLNGLIEAGFKSGFISFPVLDGEFPGRLQGNVRSQYLLLEAATRAESYNENRVQYLKLLQSKAQEIGLIPLPGINRDWFCVDGVRYVYPFEDSPEPLVFPGDILNTDGTPRHSLIEDIGCFGSNNGMLSFVNEEGRQFVAPWSKARIGLLQQHGYSGRGVVVPFSNGEIPYDPAQRELLNGLMDAAILERRGW